MTWRYQFTLLFFIGLFLVISIRLFYWQGFKAGELSALGESQYGQNIKINPTRGEIRTSDGFSLASNKISYLVFANPKEVKEKEKTIQLLSSLLQEDSASISASLALNRYWVVLKPRVDPEVKKHVEKYNLPGIGFDDLSVRFYPEASIGAKLLGFVGKDDKGSDKGYLGLEGYYDRQLRGKEGIATQVHDALGRPILAKLNKSSGEVNGRSLNLYVDRVLQFALEQELKEGIEKYGAQGGMAAIMDPKTGGILAMASFPSFDPRSYYEYSDQDFKNGFITDTYEPGSTFKPLVMAAAINEGLVKPDTHCTICSGPVEIGGYEIKTWNDTYQANLTMTEVIQHSDNTGMVFVAQKLGLDRMISYIKKYGIGDLTGIDLQGEVSSDLRSRDSWYPIDLATSGFGQGISVTPIELLSAFSTLANKGVRMEPHVVASIETPSGEVIAIPPKKINQPISEKTAKIMTEILVNAVDKGEAKFAKPKGYRIAGKTGTAQIPVAGHYDPNLTIASFIGYAPADNPKFVMLVIVDRPTKAIYGAETAAPIFFQIAKKAFAHFNVAPTESED
ncbi:MAG: penicillin-binding protein 2 [Candidatus Levybacteria bacterium]|nr:penicillin-binding protein 2 [Candidatus Levybacteria bacterium]